MFYCTIQHLNNKSISLYECTRKEIYSGYDYPGSVLRPCCAVQKTIGLTIPSIVTSTISRKYCWDVFTIPLVDSPIECCQYADVVIALRGFY